MKILFLDVDGVLNRCNDNYLLTIPAPGMEGGYIVEKNIVEAMCAAVAACGDIRIVVSSTWREMCRDAGDFARVTGVSVGLLHDDWRTPSNAGGSTARARCYDISAWLSAHPEVTEFAIIDDVNWGFGAHFGRHCSIRTNPSSGMTLKNLKELLMILGHEMPIERGRLILPVGMKDGPEA